MKKSTEELISLIQNIQNIECYLQENESEIQKVTLHDYLNEQMENKHLTIAGIMAKSEQSDYVYKVFKNQRKASRDILMAIALGMELDYTQTQMMLRISGYARLDPRNRRDAVIIYAITRHISVSEINEILYDVEERTL